VLTAEQSAELSATGGVLLAGVPRAGFWSVGFQGRVQGSPERASGVWAFRVECRRPKCKLPECGFSELSHECRRPKCGRPECGLPECGLPERGLPESCFLGLRRGLHKYKTKRQHCREKFTVIS
jgi:hypothetical protein